MPRPGFVIGAWILLAPALLAPAGCRPQEETPKPKPRSPLLMSKFTGPPLKILYVEHPPRYEYRFLKNGLIRDKELLVHCFLSSAADDDFPQEHTRSEDPFFAEPLKTFPQDLDTLLRFDVIILGDVDPALLGPKAADHLAAFVRDHGRGLAVIPGVQSNPRLWKDTPLWPILPVVPEIVTPEDERDKLHSKAHGYRLTEEGRKSPLVHFPQFKGDAKRNVEYWENRDSKGDALIEVRWFQPVREVREGATVLVRLTGVPDATPPPPLIVTREVGKGRIFWIGTDETWLWRYLSGDYPWYFPFWKGVLRWAARRT